MRKHAVEASERFVRLFGLHGAGEFRGMLWEVRAKAECSLRSHWSAWGLKRPHTLLPVLSL